MCSLCLINVQAVYAEQNRIAIFLVRMAVNPDPEPNCMSLQKLISVFIQEEMCNCSQLLHKPSQ